MSRSSRSGPSTSTDIRAIDLCAWHQIGANQKESTTEFEEDLRVKLSCHRYVLKITQVAHSREEKCHIARTDTDGMKI